MDYTPFRGRDRDPSLCCSHSPQPALLGQETSLHGVPAPEDTPKRTALSGNCVILPGKRNTGDKAFPLQRRFRYYGVDSGITESLPVLRSRFRYYRVDSGNTKSTFRSIPVLQNRFGY